MRYLHLILNERFLHLFIVFLIVFTFDAQAQVAGDYQTRADGNWNASTTWQVHNGTAWTNCTGTDFPGATPGAGTVTILNGHNVSVTANVANSIGSLVILTGNANSDVTFTGAFSLNVSGGITINPSANNNINKFVNIASGSLSAASITMNTSGGNSRDAYISIGSGTLNVSGNISMASSNVRTYILFTGTGVINIGGTITGGGITSTTGGGTGAPTSGTVNYNSAGAANIGNYTYFNLQTSNGGTKSLTASITVNNELILTSGLLGLQNFSLTLAQDATISGVFSSANMVLINGTGTLIKNFATGNTAAFIFPVGENTGTTEYSPLTIDFSTNSNAGTVGVSVTDDVASGILSGINYLSRYWNITSTLVNYTYNIDVAYSASDVLLPASESDLLLGWSSGATWQEIAGTSVNTGSHILSGTALTQTSASLNGVSISGYDALPMFNYSVKTGNLGTDYNWIDCTDGTELTSADIVAWSYSPLDDGRWRINWPFNFSVYNSSYTTSSFIGISTNGFIRFDGDPTNDYVVATNYVLNATGTNIGQVLLMGITDAYFEYDEEKVFYKVTGTAPNRVLTIDFQNMGIYGNPYLYLDIQASFYETSNKIVIKVGNNNFARDNADIGIHSGVTGYYHYWQDARYSTPYTWIEYTPVTSIPSPHNFDSYVDDTGVTQPAAANIASSVATPAQAVDVFKFKVFDTGSSDGLPTKVQRLRIKNNNPANSADWFSLIGGVVFSDGTNITNGVVSINPNYLDVEFDPGAFTVNNGTNKEITMKLYLKNASQSQNGKTFQFRIDVADHWFASDYSGSQFASNFGGTNFTSNVFTLNYTATELRFIVEPPTLAYKNTVITPNVQVALTDAAGNIATTTSGGTITLSNLDGITMSGFTATITNGIATFTSLQFLETGGPTALTTSNTGGYTNSSSNFITIAIAAILFEDDFSTNKGWTTSGTPAWQRGAQTTNGPASDHTTTSTDNFCYGTVLNANYATAGDAYLTSPIFDLAGTSNPVINFWMDLSTQYPTNGGTVQMRVMNSGVWGAWTTLDQTDEGYLANAPNYIDIAGLNNGVPGWSGNIPTGDWTLTMIDIMNLTTSGLTGITSSNQIQIRFWFGSTSSATNFPGWYIDDFSILYSTFPGLWKKTAISTDWSTNANWDDNNVPDNTTTVTIPSGAAYYPEIDETANCFKMVVYNGGLITLKTGGTLNVSRFIEVGEGTSGEFIVNDGVLNVGTNIHSRPGSTIRFNGGVSNFTDLRQTLNLTDAAGVIHFTGGTLNVAGNLLLGTSSSGSMSGSFTINLLGNFKMNHNIVSNNWPTITGGTLNMAGAAPTTITSDPGFLSRIYNLNIDNANGVSVSGSLQVVNNLDVLTTARFTNANGSSLQVGNDFTIHADDKSSGSFIDNMNTSVSGNSTVELYIKNEVWQYLGIPVQSVNRSLFFERNFYYYDESVADQWLNNSFVNSNGDISDITGWTNPSGTLNTVGRGYAYSYYASVLNFTGTLNSGDQTITVTNTSTGVNSDFDGWNLLGNPFPSGLDWDLLDKTNLDGAVYYIDDTDNSEYNNYKYYVSGGGLPSPDLISGFGVNNGTRYIPSGQGFFVRTLSTSNFTFLNSARTHTNQVIYKSETLSTNVQQIRFYVGVKNRYDEALLVLNDKANSNFDSKADAFKLFPGSKMPQIYSITPDNSRLAINFTPASEKDFTPIRLGIFAPENNNYTLKFDLANFTDFSYVYLEDKFSESFTRLYNSTEIEIYANKGYDDNRFTLYFSNKPIESPKKLDLIQVEYVNNEIIVTCNDGDFLDANLTITNASGQTIYTDLVKYGRNNFQSGGLAKGVYMVFISGIDKYKVFKLVL